MTMDLILFNFIIKTDQNMYFVQRQRRWSVNFGNMKFRSFIEALNASIIAFHTVFLQ